MFSLSGLCSRFRGRNASDAGNNDNEKIPYEDRIELKEEQCYNVTGYSYPTWKKWMILSVVFIVQTSMNYNASVYANANAGLAKEFGMTPQMASIGQMTFLVAYGFGCELWAP